MEEAPENGNESSHSAHASQKNGVTFQNTGCLLENVPTACIQGVKITLKMTKQVYPKCLNPPHNTAHCHSSQNIQKRAIRIIMGSWNNDSCRDF